MRRRFQFGLSTLLLLLTTVGAFLGWQLRVTPEDQAIQAMRGELDDVWYTWQNPRLSEMAPMQPEYTVTLPTADGGRRQETRYHDNPYMLLPEAQAVQPTPDLLDRLFRREPRVHVFGVLLPNYNATEENLSALQKLPYLKYVIVRNIHEPAGGMRDPTLEFVRASLPGTTVVGEIAKLHPKNRIASNTYSTEQLYVLKGQVVRRLCAVKTLHFFVGCFLFHRHAWVMLGFPY